MTAIGNAFAKWSRCIYKGAIACAKCPLSKADPDEGCDMAAGRTRSQEAFAAGWKQSDLAYVPLPDAPREMELVCNKCGQIAVEFGIAGECGRIELGERCRCGGVYLHKTKGGA
jgi:hypothetical protein